MIKILTRGSTRLMERYLPDPFVIVMLLTLLVFFLGMGIERESPVAMIEHWGDGFWDLLTFGMQMVLVLVTGFVLASTPMFKRILAALATLAKTPGQAIILVTVVSIFAAWINWGFGLVIGALFARQLAQAVRGVDYRLLIASAYSGFIVWHGGLASSIGLLIATDGHFAEDKIGVVSTSETIFSGFNLILVLLMLIVIPLVNRLMMNKIDEPYIADPQKLAEEETTPELKWERAADRVENSITLSQAVGVMGLVFLGYYFFVESGSLNLNIVNFMFLFLAIVLHRTPRSLLESLHEAIKGGAGIVIQFPFYAGIMAIMVQSGLAETMSESLIGFATETSLPFWSFISAGIVNLFVPSGGGQWAVQAPVMLPAAEALGVDVSRVAMAVAWGDAWTNLLQPFWALPVLAIAGLKAKDIMGFCLIQLFITGAIIAAGLTWL